MNLKTNPELLPLVEWWEKDGKQIVLMLAIVLAAFGGWKYWTYHTKSVKEAASNALVSAFTTEELEGAVANFGGNEAGGSLKLRLAKSYFDAGRFEEALAQYEALAGQPLEGYQDIPVVGKAQCLEALKKFDEALAAFDAFAGDDANAKSYLKLTAQLGAVRCLAQKGDKTTALKRIDALKTANKDDELSKSRIETTEELVKRFEPKAEPAPATEPAPAK